MPAPVAKHHGERAEEVGQYEDPEGGHWAQAVQQDRRCNVSELCSKCLSRQLHMPPSHCIEGELQPRQAGVPHPVPATARAHLPPCAPVTGQAEAACMHHSHEKVQRVVALIRLC